MQDEQQAGSSPAALHSADLDAILRGVIARHQPVPDTGVAVAVLKDGAPWFQACYGLRVREAGGAPVTPQTAFGLGSVTKTFTALAWRLHEESDRGILDQGIASYEARFALQDASVTSKISVRDLLAHRTGLPRHDVLWYLGRYSTPELVQRLRHLDPASLKEFQGRGKYSNLMYAAAGWLLERRTGKAWADFVKQRILDPIGMPRTTFTVTELAAAEHAKPYFAGVQMPMKDVSPIAAAGALNSTVEDVTRWLEMWLRRGVLHDGQPLLSEEAIEKQLAPLTPILWRGVDLHYALGWFVADLGNCRLVHHTGATDGYSTILAMVPEEGLGVCVLTNQHASLLPDHVAVAAIDAVLGCNASRVLGRSERADPLGLGRLASALQESLSELGWSPEQIDGTYNNPGYGDMVVSRDRRGRWLQWRDNRWALERATPVIPLFRIRFQGYGLDETVPLWIGWDRRGRRSFTLPFEPELPPIRFRRI